MENRPGPESYYLHKPEPYRSCMLALKDLILRTDSGICHERKFQIPFFTYQQKKLGYIWLNRKKLMLGFCVDKSLVQAPDGVKAKDQYESIQIDPDVDLPVELILEKLGYYLDLIDKG